MELYKKLKQNKKGELMLESLVVYPITLLLLFLVLAIFTTLYQRWNLQIIANESATRIAQTYKYASADYVTGEVSKEDIINIREYRYVYKKTEMEHAANTNIKNYATTRLSKTTFAKNIVDPKIEVTEYHDSLARRHINVAIEGEYSVPFGEVLSYFGYEGTTKYVVEANAECVDIIDYVNTINFVKNQTSLDQFDSELVGLINSLLSLFDNIFGD